MASTFSAPSIKPSTSSSSSHDIDNPAEPLYQVKLLAALRSGDPAQIAPFLHEIGKDKRKSTVGEIDTGAAALHLAVRCGSVETVAFLLSHRAISPNGIHPPGSGTTALHLAASLGRADIVNLLLEQDNIDDSLRDSNGRSCRDVARGKDVLRAIDDSRAFLNASYRSLLRSYILSPSNSSASPTLIALLESPRIRFVNLSYLDDDSGSSLLHEAAKRKDLRLIELAVRAGADVFVRNRRGKMAYDGAGKDERVKVFLKQFVNQDTTLIETPSTELPSLKGYLNKYTNVAKGYNTRWFVLNSGVLSYYRHQEDETVASRGSISMKTAILKTSSADRTRFEVHSTPSRGHNSGVQKWYMKANHPVEATRWIQAISKSIDWYKTDNTTTDGSARRKSGESDASGKASKKTAAASMVSNRGSLSSVSLLKRSSSKRPTVAVAVPTEGGDSGSITDPRTDNSASPTDDQDEDFEEGETSSAASSTHHLPPHQSSYELHGNSTIAQLELTGQLLTNLTFPPPPATPQRTFDTKSALGESIAVVQGMINEYVQMTREREEWYRKALEKEKARQTVWEESLATVVKEGETLEKELRMRSRKRGSRFFDSTATPVGTLRQRSLIIAPPSQEKVAEEAEADEAAVVSQPAEPAPPTTTTKPAPTPLVIKGRSDTQDTVTPSLAASTITAEVGGGGDTTDEEDEFFDAIESNNLPNLVVPESLMSPAATHPIGHFIYAEDKTLPYGGYKTLREKLPITSDDRPNTSLWSVLKNSIGKDLTKISFPVSFNEPTSMLQRMAEDMEFSECLDTAARESDPHRRLAFVAAFAMSNYSSTIGRIAKPFNPMLSETFEYVHFEKEYRYVSEQVSHHPPMSACYAESPLWHYYGEVDAQNKFMGKSFEIRPTGVAHADLILPAEVVGSDSKYPKGKHRWEEGKVVEHYSWKKVTTNISGFILGSPTIDHYGDMIVTNHRTGDQCVLTFKPRGWRGKDAFEISGKVMDRRGNITYEVAGRWNSQLIARKITSEFDGSSLHPDTTVSDTNSRPTSPSSPEYILLWRNSPKPKDSPFNLTPFAITLNACPLDTLKPYVCPTDCRLRPDQRAFELGKYDQANDLKHLQEEKQRATRKAREEGRLPPHQPRWFRAETEGDTGERVWVPLRTDNGNGEVEYWHERERVWKEKQKAGNNNGQWKDVEPIFIDEPDFIRDAL